MILLFFPLSYLISNLWTEFVHFFLLLLLIIRARHDLCIINIFLAFYGERKFKNWSFLHSSFIF
jgi:hypothetical protein